MLYTNDMRKSKSGFTLIELLVVIVVIGVLAVITLVAYNGMQGRARDDQRKTDIANIQKALELYYADNGQYPPSVNGGNTPFSPNSGWSASADPVAWPAFSNYLTSVNASSGSSAIDKVPVDPINSPNSPLNAGKYGYAYYTGNYCGSPSRQWYLLVYRLEVASKERASVGDCSVKPLGDYYYDNYGNSYVRVVR